MSLDDWILALHVLSAFAMVAAMVLFWILIVAMRNMDTVDETIAFGRLAKMGNAVIAFGVVGTIVFGIWLAISLDAYDVWDGWIVAAIVLWIVGTGTGMRASAEYAKPVTRAEELRAADRGGDPGELRALNRTRAGFTMHTLSSIAIVLIVLDMIWKPGA